MTLYDVTLSDALTLMRAQNARLTRDHASEANAQGGGLRGFHERAKQRRRRAVH